MGTFKTQRIYKKFFFNMAQRDDSVVKNGYCSSRGLELSSQNPRVVAHNCLYLYIQGMDTLFC